MFVFPHSFFLNLPHRNLALAVSINIWSLTRAPCFIHGHSQVKDTACMPHNATCLEQKYLWKCKSMQLNYFHALRLNLPRWRHSSAGPAIGKAPAGAPRADHFVKILHQHIMFFLKFVFRE